MLKFLVILWITMHPVHVTLMSVDYSADKEGFDTYLQVYFDDFLIDYEYVAGTVPKFDFTADKDKAITLIENYLRDRVEIGDGKRNLDFKISDLNMSDNELKMNLFFEKQGKSKVFHVRNSILTDIYKDQSNLLIFKYGSFEEGVKLTSDKVDHVFTVK
jgi:hypothetical protein